MVVTLRFFTLVCRLFIARVRTRAGNTSCTPTYITNLEKSGSYWAFFFSNKKKITIIGGK